MANILVIIEAASPADAGFASPASLQALGQARRLGSQLGATVYAVLPLPKELPSGEGDLLTLCGHLGADKVILLADNPSSEETPVRGDDRREVSALLHACRQLPPVLLLFGDSEQSRTVAAPLSEALGALYLPGGGAELAPMPVADAETQTLPEMHLGALRRALLAGVANAADDHASAAVTPAMPDLSAVAHPRLLLRDGSGAETRRSPEQRCVVLTVPAGRYPLASGSEAEMLVLPGG